VLRGWAHPLPPAGTEPTSIKICPAFPFCKKEREALYRKRALSGREGEKWAVQSKALREKVGATMQDKPFTSRGMLSGVKKTPRILDLLDTVYLYFDKHEDFRGRGVNSIVVDYSVSVNWALENARLHDASGMSRNTEYFSYHRGRALVAEEAANLLGFGHKKIAKDFKKGLKSLNDSEAKELTSNAMALGSMSVVMIAALVHIPGLFSKAPETE
jgi:hypothetical protein